MARLIGLLFLFVSVSCGPGRVFYTGEDWCTRALSTTPTTPCQSFTTDTGDLLVVTPTHHHHCPLSRGPWFPCQSIEKGPSEADSEQVLAGKPQSKRPLLGNRVARMLAWGYMAETRELAATRFYEVLESSDAMVGAWEHGQGLVVRYRIGFVTMGQPALMMRAVEILVPLTTSPVGLINATITAFSEEAVGADEIHGIKASCSASEFLALNALTSAEHHRPLGCLEGKLYYFHHQSCKALDLATNATEPCPFSGLRFTVSLKEAPELIGVGAILWIAAAVAGTGLFAVAVAVFDTWSTSRKRAEGRAKEERLRVLDRFLDTGEIDTDEIEKED
jgi:hypothetical protein